MILMMIGHFPINRGGLFFKNTRPNNFRPIPNIPDRIALLEKNKKEFTKNTLKMLVECGNMWKFAFKTQAKIHEIINNIKKRKLAALNTMNIVL